jgi:hypothetical protein
MDTGVPTLDLSRRIHNLGLVSDKQNYLIVSGVVALIGTILVTVGASAPESIQRMNGMTSAEQQVRLL